jgi:hypothetical protein
MFVHMVSVLVVKVTIVHVIHVVPVLDGLVAIALEMHPLVIGVNVLLPVPFPIVEMIDMTLMVTRGVTVSGQVLVIGGLVLVGHGISLV